METNPKDRPVTARADSCANPACTALVSGINHVLDGAGRAYCTPGCVEFGLDLMGKRLDDPA